MGDEAYVSDATAKYDKKLLVIAGVEGSGKTSFAGIVSPLGRELFVTTLTGEDIAFIRHKRAQGYHIELAYIGLDSLGEHFSRIDNRVRKGGKGTEPVSVRVQYENRWESLNKVLPLCDEAKYYDNGNGFRCVGRYSERKMTVMDDTCLWFQRYLTVWH